MRDVAAAANVGLMTVSRVVNGEARVQPVTAERVLAAMARLGYRHNHTAANLRRGLITASIGLIVEDVADPFYSTLMKAVEEAGRARAHFVLIGNCGENPELERSIIASFCAQRVDGLIIVPTTGDHGFLRSELARGTAVVFADRPAAGLPADTVLVDNFGGARDGVRHLIDHGHRKVAYVGNEPVVFTRAERLRGYRVALDESGLRYDEAHVRLGATDVAEAEVDVDAMLQSPDPPTAVFGANSRMTVGALRAIRRSRVPTALVGFDDFELADMVSPGVTVVAQDPYALGITAAKTLFARLDGEPGEPRQIMLPTRLVPRGLGEIRPGQRR
jgi:LacI family transcriptional regulator